MNEEWRPIAGYEGIYEVSTLRRIKCLRTSKASGARPESNGDRVMRQYDHWKGYKIIFLYKGGKRKFFVHRLVAETFLPNPENKPIVNHMDGDKRNNRLDNFEWVTDSENQQHSRKVLSKLPDRKVTLKDYAVEDMLEHALASF